MKYYVKIKLVKDLTRHNGSFEVLDTINITDALLTELQTDPLVVYDRFTMGYCMEQPSFTHYKESNDNFNTYNELRGDLYEMYTKHYGEEAAYKMRQDVDNKIRDIMHEYYQDSHKIYELLVRLLTNLYREELKKDKPFGDDPMFVEKTIMGKLL